MMMIYRSSHKSDFTCVSNELIRDKRISLAAKGLMLAVLSFGDNWNFTIKGLAQFCGICERTAYRYLAELEKAGYARNSQEKNNEGRYNNRSMFFYETAMTSLRKTSDTKPQTEEPKSEEATTEEAQSVQTSDKKPHAQKPHAQKPHAQNVSQSNINQSNIKDNKISSSSKSSSESELIDDMDDEDEEDEEKKNSGISVREMNAPLLEKPPSKDYSQVRLQINADKLRLELGSEITDIAAEIVFEGLKSRPVRVGGRIVDGGSVYKAFSTIGEDEVRDAVAAMQSRGGDIRSPKSYLTTLLYNRGAELSAQYEKEKAEDPLWQESTIDIDAAYRDALMKYQS